MATSRNARVDDAPGKNGAVTGYVGACQDVLQGLPEGASLRQHLHQSPVYLPEAGWLCM